MYFTHKSSPFFFVCSCSVQNMQCTYVPLISQMEKVSNNNIAEQQLLRSFTKWRWSKTIKVAFFLDTNVAFLWWNAILRLLPRDARLISHSTYENKKVYLPEDLQTLFYHSRSYVSLEAQIRKLCAPQQGYSLHKCKSYLNHWMFVCGMDSKM